MSQLAMEIPPAFTRAEIEAAMREAEAILAGRAADKKAPADLVDQLLAWATRIVPGELPY